MKKSISPMAVGGFVLGAAALAITAVMILWGSQLFTRSHAYVLYFKGDVNGLRIGAPVKFNGVQVGYVQNILLSLGPGLSSGQPVLTIPVIVELTSGTVVHAGSGFLHLDDPDVVKDLVQHGMRGLLASESLVTGVLYVNLEMQPGTLVVMRAPANSAYPEIPTEPTPIEQAQAIAMRVLSKLGQVDLDALIEKLSNALTRTSELAGSPQLKAAVDALPGTIQKLGAAADSIQRLSSSADRDLAETTASLRATTVNANQALMQTQATLKAVRDTIGPGSSMGYQLAQTLNDLSEAARSMRALADYLDRNPSAILRGRSPQDKP
jgi:paraquat-inducible protein B